MYEIGNELKKYLRLLIPNYGQYITGLYFIKNIPKNLKRCRFIILNVRISYKWNNKLHYSRHWISLFSHPIFNTIEVFDPLSTSSATYFKHIPYKKIQLFWKKLTFDLNVFEEINFIISVSKFGNTNE